MSLSEFKCRFGPIGAEIADALKMFSLDVVGVIAKYTVLGRASPGCYPVRLCSWKRADPTGCILSIACVPNGEIWVAAHQGGAVFDRQGRFVRAISGRPSGVAFGGSDKVYAVELGTVAVFDLDGSRLRNAFFSACQKYGQFWAVAVDIKRGRVFLCGPNYRVYVFSPEGVFHHRWSCAERSTESLVPNGIAINEDGEVVISYEYDEPSLLVFSWTGKFLRACKQARFAKLEEPTGVACDDENHVFVCDQELYCVKVFDAKGDFVTQFGWTPEKLQPRCACVDGEGTIYIGDTSGNVRAFAFPS
jgi:sugar lactone lactonase YvrE